MLTVRVDRTKKFSVSGEKTELVPGVPISLPHGSVVICGDELRLSPKGGRPPIVLKNDVPGWYELKDGAFVSEWRRDTLEAYGLPVSLLKITAGDLPTYLFGETKQEVLPGRCRYTWKGDAEKKERKIEAVDVSATCTPADLEQLLGSRHFEERGCSFTFGGIVEAYWDYEKAAAFLRRHYRCRPDVCDFGYPKSGNTCLRFKLSGPKANAEFGESVFLRSSYYDCGVALLLQHVNAYDNEDMYPFSLIPSITHVWGEAFLRPAVMLLKQHGWRVFQGFLQERHVRTLEAFDAGPRAAAKMIVKRYGIEYLPNAAAADRRFFISKNQADDFRGGRAVILDPWDTLRHGVDLASASALWQEEFTSELMAASGGSDSCWISKQPYFERLVSNSDGTLEGETDGKRTALGAYEDLVPIERSHLEQADNLIEGSCSMHSFAVLNRLKIDGFLSIPLSPPAFWGRDDESIGYVFRPNTPRIVLVLVSVSIVHEVRAVLVEPSGQVKGLRQSEVALRFRAADWYGACVKFEQLMPR